MKKVLLKIINWTAISIFALITLLIAVYAVLNFVWGRELRSTLAELKAKGEPMTLQEIIMLK